MLWGWDLDCYNTSTPQQEEVWFGNSSWATPSAVAEHITHSWDRDNSLHIEHSKYIQCSKHIQCNTHIQHSKLGSHCQQLQRHHGVSFRTVCSTHKLQGHLWATQVRYKYPMSLFGLLRHSKCQMPLPHRHSKCPMTLACKDTASVSVIT